MYITSIITNNQKNIINVILTLKNFNDLDLLMNDDLKQNKIKSINNGRVALSLVQ